MRLAVVADIHGNLPALEAVVADMAGRRLDDVVNLGDCVSGPLWPRETAAYLRARNWPTVRGNHDRWVGLGNPAVLSRTDAFTHAALDRADRDWLARLPARLDLAPGLVAFHASPDDDDAYLLEEVADGRLVASRPAAIAGRLGRLAGHLVLCAHSHLAGFVRLPDGRWIVNPGSVGCPAYDDPTPPAHVSESGSPAARYAVIDVDPGNPARISAELIALPYDHVAASRRALACDRPDWAAALSSGFCGDR